ncbi:unnamed protein product [Brassica oleracea var. botrytis]
MTARYDVATKSADSVNAKSDLSEEEIEAKAKLPSSFPQRPNFEFGVGLQMGTGNWGRYSLLQIVVLLLSKAVKVFTEELVPANPDILEGILGRLMKDLRRKDSFFSGRRTSAIGKML